RDFSGLPMLEPTNVQEMKDMTIAAFDLSEELALPVIIRTTTRLNHIRAAVELGELKPVKTRDTFQKIPSTLCACRQCPGTFTSSFWKNMIRHWKNPKICHTTRSSVTVSGGLWPMG
ncbi:MAG: hypothetical protein L6406_17405, partial [Desulfobacterales bacterium]|nr:hypothetical protein [Desulfobacterales bacterium]